MHTSIKLDTPCEFINITPLNPLISKCQIKVCYVGDKPNRNKSIITKDVARQMANSLPGSPIVGYFNEGEKDFEEHNTEITYANGKFRFKDGTRPYGFVDLNAKCWFQKFLDDGKDEREYLMTEGYLWTGQYPEAQRVVDKGNNQSMELYEKTLNANWTKDNNGNPLFFIINEAIISKLCILGEECEPCFEGANITKVQFSFDDDFKENLHSMVAEMQDLLNKGGTQVFATYAVKVGDSLWNSLYSFVDGNGYSSIDAVLTEGDRKFAVIKDRDNKIFSLDFSLNEDGSAQLADQAVEMENYVPAEAPQFAAADVEAFVTEFKKKPEEEEEKKDDSSNSEEEKKPEDAPKDDKPKESEEDKPKDSDENQGKPDEEDKKKKKYSLEDIPEYTAVVSELETLKTQFAQLQNEKKALEEQIAPLQQFKLATERVQKEDMIKNEFFMLSDEDKKDVMDHIDEYSLADIEAKLSVICVRNKVSFTALDEDENKPTTYNLGGLVSKPDSVPAWVQAVLDKENSL